jgi:hypothetical protein
MKPGVRPLLAASVAAAILTGCAGPGADHPATSPSQSAPAMTPGMVMPDGSTMGAISPRARSTDHPSAAALMICAAETRSDIATVLKLKSSPAASSSWESGVYTCTYRLPMGRLVLSVTHSPDHAAATRYVRTERGRLPDVKALAGLTDQAFGTPDGVVLLLKDDDTLRVDATALPPVFGKQGQRRSDFAYEVASTILGCWTGDE